MNLECTTILNYGDDGQVANEGDKIKVWLTNGEILIGDLYSCDKVSINLERQNDILLIGYEEIVSLEVLGVRGIRCGIDLKQ